MKSEGADGVEEELVEIYEHDIYPIQQIDDAAQGGYVTLFRVHLPHMEPTELVIRAKDLYEPSTLMGTLASKGVYIKGHNIKRFNGYMISYVLQLQKLAAAQKLYAQMGWHDGDTRFVNGPNEYCADGTVNKVGVSDGLKNSLRGMGSKGSLEEWKRIFNVYSAPGFEAHAFGALTAFGAPIFKFSGYSGVMLNMVGESGSGKSTVLRVINSVYGTPDGPMLSEKDSVLSFYHRLGVANNLPVTFDEVTEMEPKNLSSLCYAVSQGRGKNRLKQDGSERENTTSWQTIIASTSNSSLFDKLANHKTDASAESMRVFEYYVNQANILKKSDATAIFDALNNNYGTAGDIYLRYIVANLDTVKRLIKELTERFDKSVNTPVRERFWSSLVACNLAGGIIAKKLGLHSFDMDQLLAWAVDQVQIMRGVVNENTQDPKSVLSNFLNNSLANLLVVSVSSNGKEVKMISEPRGALLGRIEQQVLAGRNGRYNTFIYISQRDFKLYCTKVGADYTMVKKALEASRILLEKDKKKVLGSGTVWGNTGQVMVWKIDGDHAAMGGLAVRVIGNEPLVAAEEAL
jgi:energy-coupling factor transporter ATP-binding protein EcfA2